ncbi:hypothetical protein BDQ17DRAFT_1423470 [Cyathus striatus]|nr:hypothetical protein BDQ17DRAFT_1423470 [Cyathus striatus]
MSRHPSPGPSTHPPTLPTTPPLPPLNRNKSLILLLASSEAQHPKDEARTSYIIRTTFRRPPSPEIRDRNPLPPVQGLPPSQGPQPPPRSLPPIQQSRDVHDNTTSMEPDPALVDYIRNHGNPRVAPGPDGRPVPVLDHPMSSSGPQIPAAHSPRRTSGVHENIRHLPPIHQAPPQSQYEPGRSHSHSLSHTSPPMHHPPPPSHSSSSHDRQERHERTKSHSSSRSRSYQGPPQPYAGGPYSEALPPVQHVMHSPPLSERERPRRHELYDYGGSRSDPHHHGHVDSSLVHMSPGMHSSDSRSSSRIHNHQRIGPGTYINLDDERNRDLDRERDRDWEHDRETERSRDLPVDRADYHDQRMTSRIRDDQSYYQETSAPSNYPLLSRSGSPGSVSADGSSRPDSRTQFYEQDRTRSSYRLRPVNQPNEDIDFVHEDGRSQSRDRGGSGGGGNYPLPEHSHPSMGARKRNRNDMDVDSENDVGEGPPGGGHYSSGRLADDRSSKRYHREHPRRSSDNHEDSRMGPS